MEYKPPYLFFEFAPLAIQALGNNPLAFLKTLVQEGYSLQQIEGSKLISITPEIMIELAKNVGKIYNILAHKKSE